MEQVAYALHMDGMTVPEIAEALGVSESRVHDAIVAHWASDKARGSRKGRDDG